MTTKDTLALAPYPNCRFRICDLPGQCKGEGKCHHPAVPQAQQAQEPADQTLIYVRNLYLYMAAKYYPEAAPFDPQDDVLGLLTQIDNIVTGLVKEKAQQAQEPVAHGQLPDFDDAEVTDTAPWAAAVEKQSERPNKEWYAKKIGELPDGNDLVGPLLAIHPAPKQAQEPDLSDLKPQTKERIREWLADGTFVSRAIGTMQEQEREIMAHEAKAAPKQAQEPVSRPCHVFNVKKYGSLTEWEPTTMAFALPDGTHALYTSPQFTAIKEAQEPAATVPDNSQNWAGMDGTTAWHLIERHADGWADVGKMMDEWLAANQQAQELVPTTQEDREWALQFHNQRALKWEGPAPKQAEPSQPEFFAQYEYDAPNFDVVVAVYQRHPDKLPSLVHKQALPAQQAEPIWKPIESAPKDGTRIVAVGDDFGTPQNSKHYVIAAWINGRWEEMSEWNQVSELAHLTHWMPLPTPPEAK